MYVLKEFLSVEEAALFLGMSKSQIYKMSSSREITCYKPHGKNVYFLRQDLENWIRLGKISSKDDLKKEAEFMADKYLSENSAPSRTRVKLPSSKRFK